MELIFIDIILFGGNSVVIQLTYLQFCYKVTKGKNLLENEM